MQQAIRRQRDDLQADSSIQLLEAGKADRVMHAGHHANLSQEAPGVPPAGPSLPAAKGAAEEAEPATPGRSTGQPAEPAAPGGSEAWPAEPVTPSRTTDRAEASTKDVTLHAELAQVSGWSALPKFAAGATQPALCAHAELALVTTSQVASPREELLSAAARLCLDVTQLHSHAVATRRSAPAYQVEWLS